MSIERDAGQMVFGCYNRLGVSHPSEATLKQKLADGKIGGVLMAPWNLRDFTPPRGGAVDVQRLAAKIAEFINTAWDAGNDIPFIAADQEGGAVQRISQTEMSSRKIPNSETGVLEDTPWAVATAVSTIPTARDVGAKDDASLAADIGNAIGSELRVLGFNLDFAPVADLGTGTGIIASAGRAYSADPAAVTAMAGVTADAMFAAGIMPCIKHFPGHGATDADSHETIAHVTKTRAALDISDLWPFQELAPTVPMVMVGHLYVDAIDPLLPAILSPNLIKPILRQQFGFTGVVITDDLFMKGASRRLDGSQRPTDEIMRLGLEAGVDIFLSQTSWEAVFDSLVRLGAQSVHAARIEESADRVRQLKNLIAQFTPSATVVDDLKSLVESHSETIARVNRR